MGRFQELNDHPPAAGDRLVSLNRNAIPCYYQKRVKGGNLQTVWHTYASINLEYDGWYLEWNPVRGMVIIFHKQSHDLLFNHPWIQQVEVIRQSRDQKSLIAKVIE